MCPNCVHAFVGCGQEETGTKKMQVRVHSGTWIEARSWHRISAARSLPTLPFPCPSPCLAPSFPLLSFSCPCTARSSSSLLQHMLRLAWQQWDDSGLPAGASYLPSCHNVLCITFATMHVGAGKEQERAGRGALAH